MSISIRRNQYSAVVQPFVPSRCFSRPSLRHRGRFENLLPFLLLLDTSELGSFSMEEPRPMPPEQQGAYFSGSLHSPLSTPPLPFPQQKSKQKTEIVRTMPPYLYPGYIPSNPFASSTPPETECQHFPGQTKCHCKEESIWHRTSRERGVLQRVHGFGAIVVFVYSRWT